MGKMNACPFCGNIAFSAHQQSYHDVIVDKDNTFVMDAGVYESEDPYGPYTCTMCGAEFDELDPATLETKPAAAMLEKLRVEWAERFAYGGKRVPITETNLFSEKDWTKVMGGVVFPDTDPKPPQGIYADIAKRLMSFVWADVCLPEVEEDMDDIMKRGQLWLGNRSIKMKGEPSRCHSNVAGLFERNRYQFDIAIATGYALSKDGIWRQHSWLLRREPRSVTLVETTEKRLLYYGFVLTPWESDKFVENNS